MVKIHVEVFPSWLNFEMDTTETIMKRLESVHKIKISTWSETKR